MEKHQATDISEVSEVTKAINRFIAENPQQEDPVMWPVARRSMLEVEWED